MGPARTSISAIAEHAGVRRSTVYRHFPDEDALLDACSTHWAAANPLPRPSRWREIGDDAARLRTALSELYAWFSTREGMLDNLLRDEAVMPAVASRFATFRGYLEAAREAVRPAGADPMTTAAIGHALAFRTWQSLVREQGLGEREAVDAICAFVAAVG